MAGHAQGRFIPACAGNTRYPSLPAARATSTVHPRLCGEHLLQQSPGNYGHYAVHPRLCGEHVDKAKLVRVFSGGLSPPVRGTLALHRCNSATARFIPACAGNTSYHVIGHSMRTVHPRLCGEHHARNPHRRYRHRFIPACAGNTKTSADMVGVAGSSPPVRGTH